MEPWSRAARPAVLLAAILPFLGACEQVQMQKPRATTTQIAVKVDGTDISVHQLNAALEFQDAEALVSTDAEATKKQILDGLIDQQVSVLQASREQVDRTPDALLMLEDARQKTLARLYYKKFLGAQLRPTSTEIQQYYFAHPELFVRHKTYTLGTLAVPGADDAVRQLLRTAAATGRDAGQISQALRKDGVAHTFTVTRTAADELPADLAVRLDTLPVGAVALYEGEPGSLELISIDSSESTPVTPQAAEPLINRYLYGKKLQAAAAEQQQRLRQTATVEYVGDFARYAPAAAPAAATPVTQE